MNVDSTQAVRIIEHAAKKQLLNCPHFQMIADGYMIANLPFEEKLIGIYSNEYSSNMPKIYVSVAGIHWKNKDVNQWNRFLYSDILDILCPHKTDDEPSLTITLKNGSVVNLDIFGCYGPNNKFKEFTNFYLFLRKAGWAANQVIS